MAREAWYSAAMRMKRERILSLAKTIAEELVSRGLIVCPASREELARRLDHVLQEEIHLEDMINEEVREILKAYESQIRSGAVDYQRMFQMVKAKLVKERGIIL